MGFSGMNCHNLPNILPTTKNNDFASQGSGRNAIGACLGWCNVLMLGHDVVVISLMNTENLDGPGAAHIVTFSSDKGQLPFRTC